MCGLLWNKSEPKGGILKKGYWLFQLTTPPNNKVDSQLPKLLPTVEAACLSTTVESARPSERHHQGFEIHDE
jgi:hypothetical protein